MKSPMLTLVVLALAFVQLGWAMEASAQSETVRRLIEAQARTIAPGECGAIVAPSNELWLDEQLRGWKELEACIAASAAATRAKALAGDREAQSLALLQAPVEQKVLADIGSMREEVKNQQDFLGYSWGVGFGFGWSDEERIEQAQIVNNIVRATKVSSEQARVFLESHWFPESWAREFRKDDDRVIVRAHGPFITVSSRDDKALSGVGAGWMVGFRDKSGSEGFGVALGAILDNEVTSLADGFEDGQPPPNGETAIRTVSKSRVSYVVFFTRSFD